MSDKVALLIENEQLRARVAELEQQLASRGGVPEGWKLVPVEPTPEMLAATGNALPTGATLRCRRCGDTSDVAFSYSRADQPRPAELLREALLEMRHARKFIASREKMHPVGIEQFDQTCAAIDAALAKENIND